nr:hypothetical protein [Tanacetum cinerariifolium]
MASAVICLSKGQKFNFSKYIFDSLVCNVDSSSKFYMYPRFIQLIIQNQVGDLSTHTTRFISHALTQKVFANMRRVGKGFSGFEIPLFEGMLAVRQPAEERVAEAQVQADDAVATAVVTPPNLYIAAEYNIGVLLHNTGSRVALHACIDGKKIIISKASIKRDLQLADEEGVDCLPNSTIFEQLALMGKPTRKVTQVPHPSDPMEHVADEVVHKELGDSLVRPVTTASRLEAEQDIGQTKNVVNIITEELTLAQALEALKTSKCKVKGLVIQEPSKSTTTTTTTISSEQSHDKGKGIMIEEPVNLSRKIKLGLMKKLLKELVKENEKRAGEELIQESKKKQKVEDDKEKAELKKLIKTILDEEEVAIDAIPLAVKSSWIVDWKIHKEGKKSYYQLMRANGKSQMYMFFSQML